ncbi:hypothetical protein CfE428DRAFT_1883 [Chthoniobacter flavus Ellin428]|uniref:Uncharacterized protein n=1 Tax=Chthoniobacter flavus Ellin428 TaxID=497964 RepID=B4CYZ5_9BACT|nr:hypothetical protein [Chthoniobacter flavus]EDY20686.1 hypothetical protein CfE428DRAFT_1883 [Chthoniobacter flavus Ellin428]TCO89584.1 hypothetical protein EV701_11320 [Chthoniobacter flavus]
MSSRDINLDGGEISILKALGSSSSETMGRDLIEKVSIDLAAAEVIDTIKGLMAMGYVDADKSGFYSVEDLGPIYFRINSGYAKDLKDALNPQTEKPKSKRVRRE